MDDFELVPLAEDIVYSNNLRFNKVVSDVNITLDGVTYPIRKVSCFEAQNFFPIGQQIFSGISSPICN